MLQFLCAFLLGLVSIFLDGISRSLLLRLFLFPLTPPLSQTCLLFPILLFHSPTQFCSYLLNLHRLGCLLHLTFPCLHSFIHIDLCTLHTQDVRPCQVGTKEVTVEIGKLARHVLAGLFRPLCFCVLCSLFCLWSLAMLLSL